MSRIPSPEVLLHRQSLEIETLTPVHIGDGRGKLRADVDFVQTRDGIWVVDPEKLWAYLDERGMESWRDPVFRLSQLVRPHDAPRVSAYRLLPGPGVGGAAEAPREIIGQIKDSRLRPYLPGSSLKGAIRTLLLRATVGATPPDDQLLAPLAVPRPRRERADDTLEKAALGPNPNRDLLRVLRVSDSEPVDASALHLVVVTIHSMRGTQLAPKGPGYRFGVEALAPGTRLHAELTIEHGLLDQPKLGFARHADRLRDLAGTLRAGVRDLVERERRFYREVRLPSLERFYAGLTERLEQAREDEFFAPVGWGAGWLGMTLGPALADAPAFATLRQQYGLGRAGWPFPKTRRLVEEGGQPAMPVGWVRVQMGGDE